MGNTNEDQTKYIKIKLKTEDPRKAKKNMIVNQQLT